MCPKLFDDGQLGLLTVNTGVNQLAVSILKVIAVIIKLSPLLKPFGKLEAIIAIKKQLGFDPEHPPSNYTGSYNYSLVEYGVGKPKVVLNLFRDKELKDLFREAFNTNNYIDFQNRVNSFVEQTSIGDEVKQLGLCLEDEINEFCGVFNGVVDRSRSVSDVRFERKLDENQAILKRLENELTRTSFIDQSAIEKK